MTVAYWITKPPQLRSGVSVTRGSTIRVESGSMYPRPQTGNKHINVNPYV